MKVPSEEAASQATKLLKSEVKQVLNDEVNKLDENVLRKVFGVVTAALVAVSAYAYIVWSQQHTDHGSFVFELLRFSNNQSVN